MINHFIKKWSKQNSYFQQSMWIFLTIKTYSWTPNQIVVNIYRKVRLQLRL